MSANLDILDSYRQTLVNEALERDDLEHLNTAIAEVERFSKDLEADDVDTAINFAEILFELESAKWKLENPLTNSPTS